MIKVVLDTNVFLSAIIFGGNPRRIIRLAINNEIGIYASPAILLEIAQKLIKKFSWSPDKAKLAIRAIYKISKLVRPEKRVELVKNDPSDNKIVECAIESKVEVIITGDKHLLSIKKVGNIKIITPTQFLELLKC